MATNITKTSGVISIRQDSNIPKYYFGISGKFTVQPNNDDIQIQISNDSYTIKFSDLRVNGQTPSTVTTALTLLNAIFGS